MLKIDFGKLSKRKKVTLGIAAILLVWYVFCLPRQLFHVPYSTVVTDRHGDLMGARIADDGQWRFPADDAAPEKFRQCLVAFEDRYFYYHPGVNPLAIGRAILQNVKAKRVVSGGSTITMQVIRLSRGEKRTVGEKVIEAILATRLEFRYSKKKIISLYASHAPFGGNVVGIDAASWRYFGHSSGELSWAEAAMLAVLPNAPSLIHLSKNREALTKKRNALLLQLYRRKIIDEIDYELALSEILPSEPQPLPQIAPHLVDYFFRTRKGEHIVTSIDKGVQTQVEDLLDRWSKEFILSDIRNMAALVIDVQTNQPVAYCGNVNYRTDNSGNKVDIIRAQRSTGSILKPLLYYTALQEGEILPDMLLPDVPININGFAPQNFSLTYTGAVPASEAIARSLNVPSVVLLRRYGVPKFYDFLKRAGITTLSFPSTHYGLSLILGGADATLWDVSAVYASMARSLLPATEGVTLSDNVLSMMEPASPFEFPSDGPSRVGVAWDKGAVWQTFDAIKEVNRPEEIDWRSIPSMQTIAWKTGTSYGFRDAWAVGVTPRYVVGVWVGNASGEGKPGLVGARTAGPVMFDIFNLLPSSAWFERPTAAFTEAEVCRLSGHLKGRFCEETDTVLISPNGLKTAACPYHIRVNLSPDERFRVNEQCIDNMAVIQESWFVLPPAWEWFYRQNHLEYKPLPPFKPGCGDDALLPMEFIYPQGAFTRVTLPRQLDGSRGSITFELAHSSPNATVFWHLDEDYITATQFIHKITLSPSIGTHSLTAVDNEGHTLSATINVE
ncbi:MAG: penicillin-binding protein 1C [Tannerella sp.]|jgi:penicillin-binding protein 1C|nr:penicillin-binding protein 1C [Tannerella sp.]